MIRISNDAPPGALVIYAGAFIGWVASFGPDLPAYGAWITIPLGIVSMLSLTVWLWKVEEEPSKTTPEKRPILLPRSYAQAGRRFGPDVDAAVAEAVRDGRVTQAQIDMLHRWARDAHAARMGRIWAERSVWL